MADNGHMVTIQFVQIELAPAGSMIILVLGRATRSGRPPSPKTRFQTGLMVGWTMGNGRTAKLTHWSEITRPGGLTHGHGVLDRRRVIQMS